MPQIPPEAMAALQQQQSGGMDITGILAQLAEMSPDEVAAALQQLGINVDPDTLHDAAAQWVERAGDKQTSGGADDEQQPAAADGEGEEEGASPSPTPSAPTTDDEAAEAAPDDEYAEGEGEADDAASGQGGGSAIPTPRTGGNSRSTAANPALARRGGGGGGGMNMDALISAALSQGDPNSMPPPVRPPGVGASRGAMPPTPATGQDPRTSAMIASIYRDAASKPRAASRANNASNASNMRAQLPPAATRRR
jgi:hypothetical protein